MESILNTLRGFMNQIQEDVITNVWDSVSTGWLRLTETLTLADVYTLIARWFFPVLAAVIVGRCVITLLNNRKQDRIWGYLAASSEDRIPLMHWENSIGRSKLSDIMISLPFISRSHAVLSFSDGAWKIADLGSKGGVGVNGKRIEKACFVNEGDRISLAGAEFTFLLPGEDEDRVPVRTERNGWKKYLPDVLFYGKTYASRKTFLVILLFQFLGGIQVFLTMGTDADPRAVPGYLLFLLAESLYYFVFSKVSRRYLEVILLAFFLCGLDLLLVAAASPPLMYKQVIAILLGIVVFTALQFILKDLSYARKLRYLLTGGAGLLMIANLLFGDTRNGAKNWIDLGFTTFQPMEFVKVAFVLAGAATLDRLLTTRNLTAFIGFSGACVGALVLMRDLGTAVVFFGAFLVIAFLRSGDIRTIALISAGAVLGAVAVVSLRPYIAARFAVWGHVWEFADSTGYQQTRTMIAAASGGLLGVGGGNGNLIDVPAADTDLVFGMLCEEWGLVTALLAVLVIVFFAVFSFLLTGNCRSSFYAISACGASSIFLIQASLNIFGSLDMLPLTGVTLPFLSDGGSSMVVCWALLAFIKAADERERFAPGISEEDVEEEEEEEDGEEEEAEREERTFDEESFFRENGWDL